MRKCILLILAMAWQMANAQLLVPIFQEPSNVKEISDHSQESFPLPHHNGEKMFFYRTYERITERRAVIEAQDIWYVSQKNGKWGNPYRLFRDVDGRTLDHLAGVSEDGNRLYLLHRYFEGDSIISMIGYRDRKGRSSWEDIQEIKVPGLSVDDSHTTLFMHPDGDVLLISMFSLIDSTNEDIYLSEKGADGNWSELIDLGRNINSKGYEFSPYLTKDKKALFFASNGHAGLGESDIFVAYRQGDGWNRWTRPINLGAPINTKGFEASFMVNDSNVVYFVSDRDGEDNDIYRTNASGEYKMVYPEEIEGQFYFNSLPGDSVQLSIYDYDGNLIEIVTTDFSGGFKFKKVMADGNFYFKLDDLEDEVYADADGKIYLKDSLGRFVTRVILNSEGNFVSYDEIEEYEEINGVATLNKLAYQYGSLKLIDENDYVVDTLYTDENGLFTYQKLNSEENYRIVPIGLNDEEFETCEVWLVDESGKKVKELTKDRQPVYESGRGTFVYKGLPVSNSVIKVLDENGDLVEVVHVNENGEFSYKKLKLSDQYNFIMESEGEQEYVDGVLYFLGKNADTTRRYVVVSDNKMVAFGQGGTETIKGVYTYKKLPAANTALVLIDENGIPVDTFYTDKNGFFEYNKMKLDGVYTIRPLDAEENELTDSGWHLINQNGETTKSYAYKAGEGYILMDESDLAIVDLKEPEMPKPVKKPVEKIEEKKEVVVPKEEKKPEPVKQKPKPVIGNASLVLNFDFNSVHLDWPGQKKLNKFVKQLQLSGGQKVVLSGHADSVGSDDVNQRISRKRAEGVKRILIKSGISADNIELNALGESSAKASNDSEDGRAANRRVEVSLK